MDTKRKDDTWTEKLIRDEIIRLDSKTGLQGASLPISFGNARTTIGSFRVIKGEMSFRFSNYFFQDPDWPLSEKLDTIRHEYAHYMDHILFGGKGHGLTWKHCCKEVGAFAVRQCDTARVNLNKEVNRKNAERSDLYATYRLGELILHPQYGFGTIVEITGNDTARRVVVDFEDVGRKCLSLQWVDQNCLRDDSCH